MAKHWKDMNLSDAELRYRVWKAGSVTVQAAFAQAIMGHLGRNIWDIEKFKADVKQYLIENKNLDIKIVDTYMKQYDENMHDFMYHGWSMEDIYSKMLKES